MIKWFNSVRAIVVVLMTLAAILGLFLNKVDSATFKELIMLVFVAYFAKRDVKNDKQ